MPDTTHTYIVRMRNADSLSADERSAAEWRFRMALEAGVGGGHWVAPALQACMLARSLTAQLTPEELARPEHDAERGVIALWENAEDRAIMTALKPLDSLNRDMGQACFEISLAEAP